MLLLQLMPVILSLIALTAHFSRHGAPILVLLSVALLGLLTVPRAWAARLLQAILLLGAAEWVRTLIVLSSVRVESGLPATRMIIILATIAILTGASALAFRTRRARDHFRISLAAETDDT